MYVRGSLYVCEGFLSFFVKNLKLYERYIYCPTKFSNLFWQRY